jgi:hypothetical protein
MNLIPLSIIQNAEGNFPEAGLPTTQVGQLTKLGALPKGMASGRASVAVLITLDDGTHVFAETSLRLLRTAVNTFDSLYPDDGRA